MSIRCFEFFSLSIRIGVRIFDQCKRSLSTHHRDKFEYVLICDGNYELESKQRLGTRRADHTGWVMVRLFLRSSGREASRRLGIRALCVYAPMNDLLDYLFIYTPKVIFLIQIEYKCDKIVNKEH